MQELRDISIQNQKHLHDNGGFIQRSIKQEVEVELAEYAAEVHETVEAQTSDPLQKIEQDVDSIITYDSSETQKTATPKITMVESLQQSESSYADELLVELKSDGDQNKRSTENSIRDSVAKKPKKEFPCIRCKLVFPAKATLVAHFQNTHNDVKVSRLPVLCCKNVLCFLAASP